MIEQDWPSRDCRNRWLLRLAFNSPTHRAVTLLYPFQRHIAPRVGLAYSPQADSGWLKRLFGGPGKTSIRAGFGMYYDEFGQSLIRIADATSLGFSATLQNAGTQTSETVPRFISLNQIPAGLLPAAPGRRLSTSGARCVCRHLGRR